MEVYILLSQEILPVKPGHEWLKSYDGNSKINFDYKLSKFSVKDVTVIFSNTERIIVENLLEKNCEI